MTDDRRRHDLEAIERLHRMDTEASKAQDFETLKTLVDAEGIVMPPGSNAVPAQAQLDARIARRASDPNPVEILNYWFDWEEVELMGDYAFERGRIMGSAKVSADSGPATLAYNIMRILKRQPDGEWKVYRSIWNEAPI